MNKRHIRHKSVVLNLPMPLNKADPAPILKTPVSSSREKKSVHFLEDYAPVSSRKTLSCDVSREQSMLKPRIQEEKRSLLDKPGKASIGSLVNSMHQRKRYNFDALAKTNKKKPIKKKRKTSSGSKQDPESSSHNVSFHFGFRDSAFYAKLNQYYSENKDKNLSQALLDTEKKPISRN